MGLSRFIIVSIVIVLLYIGFYTIWGIIEAIKYATGSQDIAPGIFPEPIAEVIIKVCFYIFIGALSLLWCILIFLIIMFILWLIIKCLIPCNIWILFIRIPVRSILLAIPPFPELTEAGILPFMERLLKLFTSPLIFLKKFGMSSNGTALFLIKASRYVIKTFVPNYNPDKYYDISKEPLDEYKIKKGACPYNDGDECDDGTGNPNDEGGNTNNGNNKKNNNFSDFYVNSLIMIENEKANCIRKNTKETTPNMSFGEKSQIQIANFNVSTQCTVKSLTGYFKTQISQ